MSDELGSILGRLATAGSVDTAVERIALTERALALLSRTEHPHRWAGLQLLLGSAWREVAGPARPDAWEHALGAFRAAAETCGAAGAPALRGAAVHRLAVTLHDRVGGDKSDNLEASLLAGREACDLMAGHGDDEDRGHAWYHVGRVLLERIDGRRQENLIEAKRALLQAIAWYDAAGLPFARAGAENMLGNVELADESVDRAAAIERAIAWFEAALRVRSHADHPVEWANTTHNLANAYRLRFADDARANAERAVDRLTSTFRVFRRDTHPSDWAHASADLAGLLVSSPAGSPTQNAERAIELLEPAIATFRELGAALPAAKACTDLGNAYLARPVGDPARNAELARAAFLEALAAYPAATYKADHARAQCGLGHACLHVQTGRAEDGLARGIEAFERALGLLSVADDPELWAGAQASLGGAQVRRAIAGHFEAAERAIRAYAAAQSVFTPAAYPHRWATLSTNLGHAHLKRRPPDVEAARAAYRDALRVFTRDRYPREWAQALGGFGAALLELPARSQRAASAREAADVIRQALEVCNLADYAEDHARNLSNLGTAAHEAGDDDAADRHWRAAFDVWADRIGWTVGTDAPARQAVRLARRRAQAFVTRGRHADAVAALEAGKAIGMRLELARARRPPAGLSDEQRSTFDALVTRARELSAEHAGLVRSAATIPATLARLTELDRTLAPIHAQLQELFARDPTYAESPPDQGAIRAIAREHGITLVYLHCPADPTDALTGWVIHPSSPAGEIPGPDRLTFAGLSRGRLNELLFGPVDPAGGKSTVDRLAAAEAGEPVGWNEAYAAFRESPALAARWRAVWRRTVTRVMDELGRHLAEPLARRLAQFASDRVVLLPDPLLTPFPLAALEVAADGATLGDRFAISVAPSAATLRECMNATAAEAPTAPSLVGFGDPDGTLPFAGWQIRRTADRFPADAANVALGRDAGRTRLLSCPPATFYCLATHARFHARDPGSSYFVLAPTSTSDEAPGSGDGRLSLDDLLAGRLRLMPGCIVTADGCETGQIDAESGHDESPGFPAAFLAAGASGVLATLWPIHDLSAALLIDRAYEGMLAGLRPPAAIARAARWLRGLRREELDAILAPEVDAVIVELSSMSGRATVDEPSRREQKAALLAKYGQLTAERAERPFAEPAYWAAFAAFGA